jgi:hypothetical protein
VRLRLEQLEDRTLLSSYSAATVSDLIAEINAANKAGGTNTITLTAPTSSPYVLTAVDNTTDGATGLPVVSKKDTLTIVGNGDTIERSPASATPDFRLFDVASGGSLTLNNLTLQNGSELGSGASADGGAIYSQGSLTLSGVSVQDSFAAGSSGANGTKSHPSGGNGQDAAGGGIWSSGTLTLENGTLVQNNSALGGNGGIAYGTGRSVGGNGGNAFGGGVYIAGGTAKLSGGTFSGNDVVGGNAGYGAQASYGGNVGGGGMYINGASTVDVTGVSVEANSAYGGNGSAGPQAGRGGGIYISASSGATITLSNNTVNSNTAYIGQGGGIYFGPSTGATITLSNDTVSSNTAYYGGGGIFIYQTTVTLCNDTVEYNMAAGGLGGGIEIYQAAVYIDQVSVTNTLNNTDSSGLNGSTANIDGTYILKNC